MANKQETRLHLLVFIYLRFEQDRSPLPLEPISFSSPSPSPLSFLPPRIL